MTRGGVATLVLATVLGATAARAQESCRQIDRWCDRTGSRQLPVAPTGLTNRQQRAFALFAQGQAALCRCDIDEATAALRDSAALQQSQETLYMLVRAYRAAGDVERELETIERMRSLDRAPAAAQRREIDAREREIREAFGAVRVSTTPADAVVRVGSRSYPPGGVIHLRPGRHVVEVSRGGYERQRRDIEVETGREEQIEIVLEEEAAVGSIDVKTDPAGAELWIDGEHAGYSGRGRTIPAGGHRIRVTLPGFVPEEREVDLAPGEWERVHFDLESDLALYEEGWFWTVVGAVVVGGLVTYAVLYYTRDVAPRGTVDTWNLP